MYYGAILQVYFLAHTNAVYITPHYCIEPYAALVTHNYITYNCSVWGYKTITSPLWMKIFYR